MLQNSTLSHILTLRMAGGDNADQSFQQIIGQANAYPDYKVLTKAEYENLLALPSKKPQTLAMLDSPRTSTPQYGKDSGATPKFTFTQRRAAPVSRLQHILNASQPLNA